MRVFASRTVAVSENFSSPKGVKQKQRQPLPLLPLALWWPGIESPPLPWSRGGGCGSRSLTGGAAAQVEPASAGGSAGGWVRCILASGRARGRPSSSFRARPE
jgi:hypothetical protein